MDDAFEQQLAPDTQPWVRPTLLRALTTFEMKTPPAEHG